MHIRFPGRRNLFTVLLLPLLLSGCTGIPDGVHAVTGFQLDRFLGTWHEIARLAHSFERGLTAVNATYSLRTDGGVDVLNRGYDAARGEWKEARGRAYFLEDPEVGSLKVSFFGPFYGGYHVFVLTRSTAGHWCRATTTTTSGSLPATGSCPRPWSTSYRGGKGMLRRIGKASFQYGVREQSALLGVAGMALKLLPERQKIKFILNGMADALKKSNAQVRAWVDESGDRLAYVESTCAICHSRHSTEPVCHLYVGSVAEAVRWATGREYQVVETHCMAKGDEYWRFEVGEVRT